MLERLNFELYQRKELCKQRELLEARKKMLQESIANRKKFISNLPSHLKSLKKASLPVQQHLGILHTKRMKQLQLAELLPAPLYIVYTQLLSQKEAFDENIELDILGSVKDAQAVIRQHAMKDAGGSAGNMEENKVDEDIPEEDDDSQRRRKRRKKLHLKESSDGGGIYYTHPLSVMLHIYDDEVGESDKPVKFGESDKPVKLLTLRFEYLLKLNIVCAGVEYLNETGPLEMLTNLFPNDTGLDLPNQVAKLSAGTDFQYDDKRSLRPYKWVQHLAGIDFLPESPFVSALQLTADENSKISPFISGLTAYRQQQRVHIVLQKLHDRIKAHLALKEQLESLAKLKFPSLNFTKVPWGLCCPKCTLHSWSEIEQCDKQNSYLTCSSLLPAVLATSNADGPDSASKYETEMLREDGELLLGSGRLHAGTAETGYDGVEHKDWSAPISAKHSGSGSGKFGSRRGSVVGLPPGFGAGTVSEADIFPYNGIDQTEMYPQTGASPAAFLCVGKQKWEDCGVREYCAVLRREDGLGGKVVELEAKVTVSSEYPLRPPQFNLHLVSHGATMPLPDVPRGVLDVVETCQTSEVSIPQFNELRAMEAEVNINLLEKLPPSEEKELLAHQFSLLPMLFDVLVDYNFPISKDRNLSIQVGDVEIGVAELVGGKMARRVIRGRDRLKLLL